VRRAGLALAVVFVSSPALAQPSIWDAARDPRAESDYQVLLGVENLLAPDATSFFDPQRESKLLRAALSVLELSGDSKVHDARLLYLAGDLLSDTSVGRDKDASRLLERALASAPDSPLAGRGWFNLAIARARMGDPRGERDAYTHALRSVYDPGFRANIYLNRGESSMVLGELQSAVPDYEKAIKLADRPDLQALAYFGLGITKERQNDLPSALDAMRKARAISLPTVGSALDLPSVFFVPWYDIHYYKALSAMSAARDAKKTEERVQYLLEAADHWQRYLEPALQEKHRWAGNAKLHFASVMGELERLVPSLKRRAAAALRAR
jgi:tetratricopeptide (TPR) repeat protein